MHQQLQAQRTTAKKATIVGWDGMAVAGYVNNGGFVNFGGPTVKLIKKPFSIGFGILPTMRIKEDNVAKGSPKEFNRNSYSRIWIYIRLQTPGSTGSVLL